MRVPQALALAVILLSSTWGFLPASAQSGCRPMCPAAPDALKVEGRLDRNVLDWELPNDPGANPITEYRIYRGTTPTALAFYASSAGTSYHDTTAGPSTMYYYHVTAVNADGEGPPSVTESAAYCEGGEDRPATHEPSAALLGVRIQVYVITEEQDAADPAAYADDDTAAPLSVWVESNEEFGLQTTRFACSYADGSPYSGTHPSFQPREPDTRVFAWPPL